MLRIPDSPSQAIPSNASSRYIVGAYAASPCLEIWDPDLEAAFYAGLETMEMIRGLEHPFYGTLHRDDDHWFLRHVKPEWDYVFTCIPGTMNMLKTNPLFGLASADEDARRQAVAYHAAARDAVAKLNAHLGRRAVIAVQVHSAPTKRNSSDSSAESLARSLAELHEWDWEGAALVLEHCDAFTTHGTPEKGFLTLDEELHALAACPDDSASGIMVNWGRSAIEGRSAATPFEHIIRLRNAGVLRGLIFSGVGTTEDAYGAWKDTHMPPRNPGWTDTVLPEHSLMTPAEIGRCLSAAGQLDYLGAKVMLRPQPADLSSRLRLISETIRVLDSARQ